MIQVLLSAVLAMSPPAEVEAAKKNLPLHSLRACGGERQACFSLASYKELLQLSADNLLMEEEMDALRELVDSRGERIMELELALEQSQARAEHWKRQYDKQYVKWQEENELRHKAEVKAASPWPAVQLAVGSAAALAGSVWAAFDDKNPGPWALLGVGLVVDVTALIDFID